MNLSEYVSRLKGDNSYNDAAKETGVSTNTLYKIIKGQTSSPTPDIFAKLSTSYGGTKQRQRQIYADLMRLAGYLDMMPRSVWDALREQGSQDDLGEYTEDSLVSSFSLNNVIPEAQDALKEMCELSESEQRDVLGVLRATLKLVGKGGKAVAPSAYATEEISSIAQMLEELPDHLLSSVSWGIRSHIRSIYETIEEEKRRAKPLNPVETARLQRLQEAFKRVAPEAYQREEDQLAQLLGGAGSKARVQEEPKAVAA